MPEHSRWRDIKALRQERVRLQWNLEQWIWEGPWPNGGWCNHEAEYATYTHVPDDSPYWARAASEDRLGPHKGTLPWWEKEQVKAIIARVVKEDQEALEILAAHDRSEP